MTATLQDFVDDTVNEIQGLLSTAVDDAFGGVEDAISTSLSSLNSIDIQNFLDSLTNDFDNTINQIQVFITSVINDIQNLLQQPIQDVLSITEFVAFLSTIVGIILNTITTVLKLKVGVELVKPLFQFIIDMVSSLYTLKNVVYGVLRVKFESIYQQKLIRFNIRKTKFVVRSDIRKFIRKSKLQMFLFNNSSVILLSLCLIFFSMIYESRNNISKYDF